MIDSFIIVIIIIIIQIKGKFTDPKSELYLGNAGTAARFLASVCTLVQGDGFTTITGNKRMKVRPIGPLVDALRGNGFVLFFLKLF